MPIFAAFVGTLFGALTKWAAGFLAKKTAYLLINVAAVAAAFAALKIALAAIVAGISYSLPADLTIPFSWVIPANLNTCLAAYGAAQSAVWLYKWKWNIQLAASSAQ